MVKGAQLHKIKMDERLRTRNEVRCRVYMAWGLNWFFYILSALIALTFGVSVFGGDSTNEVLKRPKHSECSKHGTHGSLNADLGSHCSRAIPQMITLWVMALLQCYLIFEPCMIFWTALSPWCVGDETYCGRCCGSCRWFFSGELTIAPSGMASHDLSFYGSFAPAAEFLSP